MSTTFHILARTGLVLALSVVVASHLAAQSSSRNSSSNSSSGSSGLMQTFSLDGSSSSSQNAGGFVGSSGSSDFVGSSSTGTGTSGSAANRSTNTSRTSSANSRTNTGRTQGTGNTSINRNTQVQPRYTLGFAPPQRDAEIVSTALAVRFNRTPQTSLTGAGPAINVTFEDGVALVEGAVATEHDRKVLENMVRVQSGVSGIRSEIQIDSSASSFRQSRMQDTEVVTSVTPQGQHLIHNFAPPGRLSVEEIGPVATPQGRQLVYVF